MISTIKQQAKDLFAELNRVDWPDKAKVRSATYGVVSLSIFVGLYLYLSDRVIAWGIAFILPNR